MDETRVRLEQRITVNRSVQDLYEFWKNVENWPQVMPHLDAVTRAANGRFHWALKGPSGATVRWNAAITEDRPNERIAWKSLTRGGTGDRGSVRFDALGPEQTEVIMTLDYSPTGTPVGAVTGRLLGDDPAHRLEDQLGAFKRLMEAGIDTTA
jgi:uncharacterized membrane protein